MILLMLYFVLNVKPESELQKSRSLYLQAPASESATRSLLNLLGGIKDGAAIFEAYKGAATVLMAKHSLNPYKKLGYFKKGTESIEAAIRRDPQNLEARFLRLSIQNSAPSFLGYNNSIKTDVNLLIYGLGTIDDQYLFKMITSYLRDCDCLDKEEKKLVTLNSTTL